MNTSNDLDKWDAPVEFDWGVTSEQDNPETIETTRQALLQTTKENLEKKYKQYLTILKTLKPEAQERAYIIVNFYNRLEDNEWNYLFKQFFQTKKHKNLINFIESKYTLLDYKIVNEPTKSLEDEKYKTATIERYYSWQIADDKTFSNYKPEILDFIGTKFYQVKAHILQETVTIPYIGIMSTLKEMETKYAGIIEFVFNSDNQNPKTLKELKKDGYKFLQEDSDILLNKLRYRNDEEHSNNFVWNVSVNNKTIIKDIGFFSYAKMSRIIGNVWIDEKFRGNGISHKIFEYIAKTILPKEKSIFILTKNPIMEKGIKEISKYNPYNPETNKGIRSIEIGRDKPYKSPLDTSEKLTLSNEKVFVVTLDNDKSYLKDLADEHLPNGMALNLKTYSDLFKALTYIPFDKFCTKVLIDTIEDDKLKSLSGIKLLNYTNDENILPEVYNKYINEMVKISVQPLIIEDEYWYLPIYNTEFGPEYFLESSTDIRSFLIKPNIEFEIFETDLEWIVLINKELLYYTKKNFEYLTKENLEKLFSKRFLGVENIFKNIGEYEPKRINYKNLTISYQVEDIVSYKDYSDIIKDDLFL